AENSLQIEILGAEAAAFGAILLPPRRVAEVPVGVARLRPLLAARVDFTVIETFPLLGVGQKIVGGADGLEPLRRLRFSGIYVRMVFLREFAIGGADRGFGRVALHAQ